MSYLVSNSPHILSRQSTRKIMLDVVIALMPAWVAGIIVFGVNALIIGVVSILSAVGFEALYNVIAKQQQSINDFSAVVTGLLLALNLPPLALKEIYIPIIGACFAIMIVKMLFGGLGKNFANPAITARIFLLLCFTGAMTTFTLDGVTTATPLPSINAGEAVSSEMLKSLFLGNVAGCIGETSALALLIGGIYLLIKRIIDWKIPVIYIATVAALTGLLNSPSAVLPSVLGGGLLIGAFFMATDYATSPNTTMGIIVYSVGLGVITVILRLYSSYPEGVSFAILLMNLVVPLLDKYFIPKPFGYQKPIQKEQTT